MDKRVIFAVAGSGKTTYIVESLSHDKRSLIVTYTINNYTNLSKKIIEKFDGTWPCNISLMTYFQFLYRFCYKPFLSDKVKAKGVLYESNPNRYANQNQCSYYLTAGRYFYSNRLALFLGKANVISDIKDRIETYFDEFIIDEVQDIAGRDFDFLELLMGTNVNMLFVGDFYQHTFDTSRDGNVNIRLHKDRLAYEARFINRGFRCDSETLQNSWRCSISVCEFISTELGINICSNRKQDDNTIICFVSDKNEIEQILGDSNVVKLHYQNSVQYGVGHKNWGDTKGEDCYSDVCVMLNKTTMSKYSSGKMMELPASTRNKLYVAITRAHGNCYIIEE